MAIRLSDVTMEEFAAIRLLRSADAEYQKQKAERERNMDEARRAPRR